MHLKFIYSEKATKFCEIFPLLLTVCTIVKSKGKISQNFVAFSEYMNFKNHQNEKGKTCQNIVWCARKSNKKFRCFFLNNDIDYDLQSILMACIFYFSAVSHRQKPISISSKLPDVVNSTVSRCMLPRWETLKNNVSNIFLPLSAECFKSVSPFVPYLCGKYLRLPLHCLILGDGKTPENI